MEKIFVEEVVTELHTIQDMLRWSVSRFNAAGIYYGHGTDNAWDEAVALVLHSLHLPVDIDPQIRHSRLTSSEKHTIVELVTRRVKERIPVPYLTNSAWFAGMEFYVDERVLVPRSPIAELIEARFSPWLYNKPVNRILDLCTGSGCIAIACAHAFPDAEVDALDISTDALAVAEMNIQHHQLEDRVIPMQSDLLESVMRERYDLIVSNPPYVDAEDMSLLPEEFVHEPELGLAAGHDGLDLVKKIIANAPECLNDEGVLIVEVGNSQVHMESQFPTVPFTWLEFEHGGHGVFLLTREQLVEHQEEFKQYKEG